MEKRIVRHVDSGGCGLEVQEVNGYYYPAPGDTEVLRNYHSINIRPDDILLTNYPKSGSHWHWEILSQLVARKAENIRETWNGDLMIEWASPSTLESVPSPRILNTHVHFEQLPVGIIEKRCKIIHLMRNPKDVAVSMYNHHLRLKSMYKYDGEWNNYLSLFLEGKCDWGSWFDNTRSYLRAKKAHPDLPIFATYYEDMIKDPTSSLKRVAAFLEIEVDDQLCRDISAKCSMATMRAVAKETGKGLIQDGEPIIFREGGVGGWRHWFTVAQEEVFDRVYAQKMNGIDTSLLSLQYT